MVDIHFLRYIVPALESPPVQPGKADDSEAEFSRKDNKKPLREFNRISIIGDYHLVCRQPGAGGQWWHAARGTGTTKPVVYNTVEEIERFGEMLGRIAAPLG